MFLKLDIFCLDDKAMTHDVAMTQFNILKKRYLKNQNQLKVSKNRGSHLMPLKKLKKFFKPYHILVCTDEHHPMR